MSRRFEIHRDHDDPPPCHTLHRRIDRRGGGGRHQPQRGRAIVTGGASGIGIETARALAGAGAEVTLAVRNVEAGNRTAEDIAATTGNARGRLASLDLADRASVASFVAAWDGPLHILVNNAGVMALPERRTPEGWEMQFATNHFGHFALAMGLHRALAAAGGARVVSVSSGAHLISPVVFDDIHFHRGRRMGNPRRRMRFSGSRRLSDGPTMASPSMR